MVRVIIEHKTTNPERVIEIIRHLRDEAIRQPGYITGETLVNSDDPSNILVISTWQNIETWNTWDKSPLRVGITRDALPYLAEPYTVRIYEYQTFKARRVLSTL